VNTEGVDFGEVVQVVQTGANDVLVVEGERERLIPFTEEVVKKVELRDCMIRVDWPADF
jgi:16S rRNA processing protein RimM